jgi:hypothetical protein
MTVSKLFDTQRARTALAGFALHALQDDLGRSIFIATAGPVTLSFDNQAEVDRWLRSLPTQIALVEERHA